MQSSPSVNPSRQTNMHCCVVRLNGVGILIRGHAGSGKTSLMLGLLEAAKANGEDAVMVCDDQAIVTHQGADLVAQAPQSITGKVELWGHGIVEMECCGQSEINLLVELSGHEEMERMPEKLTDDFLGVELPLVRVPIRHEQLAVRIVRAAVNGLYE